MSDFDPISKLLLENYGGDIIQLIRGYRLESVALHKPIIKTASLKFT
ncbi:MAG: hypothetical protein AB1815_11950 [Bacillota bacterium]